MVEGMVVAVVMVGVVLGMVVAVGHDRNVPLRAQS